MAAPLAPIDTAIMVDALASGQSYRQVGKLLGIDHSSVLRRAKGFRALIEAQSLAYFEAMVPLSIQINQQCLDAAKTLYDTLPPAQLSEHGPILAQAHKISDRVLQSVGIAPSLAPSVVVQQFIQVNNSTILAPQLAALFSPESLAQIGQDEAVDAEWEDMDEVE